MVKRVQKLPLRLVKTSDGDYIASSSASVGFFAMGDTREEAIQNAREGLAMFLGLEDDEIELEITEVEETE